MPDLKMEIFHLMSFLLSHCASRWKAPNDQVTHLLLQKKEKTLVLCTNERLILAFVTLTCLTLEPCNINLADPYI